MKTKEYERMILDAKNEIGLLVISLGGNARGAVRAAGKLERSIRERCNPINELVNKAKGE